MNTILLINGGKEFGESGGKLSEILHNVAKETLESLGKKVLETHIDKGYDIESEVQKMLEANVWIWQIPGWWMGEPWIVKEYIDKVFTKGAGRLWNSDGRHRANPTKNYGTGGLSHDKKVMINSTWNAPLEAFSDKDEFFEGVGVDMVFFHLYKAHQFLGIKPLPSFTTYDVMKNPQVESYIANYKEHLQRVLG